MYDNDQGPDGHGQGNIFPPQLFEALFKSLVITVGGEGGPTYMPNTENIAKYVAAADTASAALPADGKTVPSPGQLADADAEFVQLVNDLGWSGDLRDYPQALEAIRVMGIRLRRTAAKTPSAFIVMLINAMTTDEYVMW